MNLPNVINPSAKLTAFDDHWHPRIIGRYGDSEIRVAKIFGAFDWHAHEGHDELFFVVEGEMTLEFRDGQQIVRQGEMVVVPKGVEHRPVADNECHILMLNQVGEPNTGNNPASTNTRERLETL